MAFSNRDSQIALQAALQGNLPAAKANQQGLGIKLAQILRKGELERVAAQDRQAFQLLEALNSAKATHEGIGQRAKTQGIREAERKIEERRKKASKEGRQKKTPTQAVQEAVSGTETESIRTQDPISAGTFDSGGARAAQAVQGAVQGGPLANAALDDLRQGASPEEALAAAMAGPQTTPSAPSPMSLQMGGQTFTAPDEITRQVSSLGAQPMRTQFGYAMAPTFDTRTITEPNVLTAGQLATLQANQEQQIMAMGMQLWQDAGEDAPLPEALDAVRQARVMGDPSKLEAYGVKYPSLGKLAAKADLDFRRASAREAEARANLMDAKTQLWEMEQSGQLSASNWRDFLYPERSMFGIAPGSTFPGAGTTGRGRAGSVGIGKVDTGRVTNNNGDINDVAWDRYQMETLSEDGVILYREEEGWSLPFAPETARFKKASALQIMQAVALAHSGEASPEARKGALEFIEELPFMSVIDQGAGKGPRIEGDFTYFDQGAADMGQRIVDAARRHMKVGVPLSEALTEPPAAEEAKPAAAKSGPWWAQSEPVERVGGPSLWEAGFLKDPERRKAAQSAIRDWFGTLHGLPETPRLRLQSPRPGGITNVGPSAPPVGPETISAEEPYQAGEVSLGDLERPRAELTAARPGAPTPSGYGTPRATLPSGPAGPIGRSLTARDVAALRALGFSPEVISRLPANVIAEILGAAHTRSVPPQIRALIPQRYKSAWPTYPPPPHRTAR